MLMAGTFRADMASNPPKRTEAGSSWFDEAAVNEQVRRFQAGDAAAFDDLVRALGSVVFNLAYRMTDSRDEADDLSQEIFVKLHRSAGQFAWKSRFSTWLYALALNQCRSRLRRLRRIRWVEGVSLDAAASGGADPVRHEAVDAQDTPPVALARRELGDQVRAAVAALPEEFRETVAMRDLQGLAYEDIVEVLGCSIGTVKSRLARGRMRLKNALAGKVP